jgi:molecular chaperone DnaK
VNASAPTPNEPTKHRMLLAEFLTQFEDAWNAGKPPKLEEFLNEPRIVSAGLLFREELFRHLLQMEVQRREALRETFAVDEYLRRFPQYPMVVAECFGNAASKIGDYRLLKLLGSGGMGEVYLALNELTEQTGALKIIRGHLVADAQAVARFMREIKSLAKLHHPNVVGVRTAGRVDNTIYLEMEYVDGENLDEVRRRVGKLSVADACAVVCQVAAALEHAHTQNVIHRDLKPYNLMLTREGTVKVLDFGLAKWRHESPLGGAGGANFQTQENASLGTPHFMAPEQLNARSVIGPGTDVYGLGATFYFLLTGETPIPGGNFLEVIAALATSPPKPITEILPDLPAELAAVVMKMLAKDPAERYASMSELQGALAKFSTGSDLPRLFERVRILIGRNEVAPGAVWMEAATAVRVGSTQSDRDVELKTPTSHAIGIDLGTTYSCVAYLDSAGRPTTIQNNAGELLTPSAVMVDADDVIIGKEAIKASVFDPSAFAECFKRDMGRDTFRQQVRGLDVPPEVLSAFVLERLKKDAERQLGSVREVVITVPAFFDETRRKATQDAGRLAGLQVLDIINEPTAAAVAYGYQNGFFGPSAPSTQPIRVLVYDLGGGTFDVTILEIVGEQFRALATDGDVQLGGKDFDERIVSHLATKFAAQHGVDPRDDPQDIAQLWLDAQEAKHALSERTRTTVVCQHKGKRARIELSRAEYAELTIDLLERTESTTSLCLSEAKLDWSKIDRILLVGGSSRMPMVSEMLKRISGKEPDRSMSPDEAIAHGAALYAGMLQARGGGGAAPASRGQLINVNSHSLGIVGLDPNTRKRVNFVLIPKNSPLPCNAASVFQTSKEDQRNVKIAVVEGESHRPEDCVAIGECVVRNLPEGLPKGTPVHVKYSYAANGRITVSARVGASRQSARVEIERQRSNDLGSLATWRKRLLGTGA